MSDTNGHLDFNDIMPIEVPVTIGGKKYLLREASGDAACKYRNAILRSTKLGPEGKPASIEGLADADPLLVSLCLFEVYDHNGEMKQRPVLLSQIKAWPARITKILYEKAKQISQLDEAEDVKVLEKRLADTQTQLDKLRQGENPSKNLPEITTVGSD